MIDSSKIFDIASASEFESAAIAIFRFQYGNNEVYRQFCNLLGRDTINVKSLKEVPFLPVELFKSKKIISTKGVGEVIFTSSGTTGQNISKHYITDIGLYEKSFLSGFKNFYGHITDYCILALLPSYLERTGSSLIYMVDDLIKKSGHPESGFYLDEIDTLVKKLLRIDAEGKKVLLIGVSFALLDLVEKHQLKLRNTLVMETGGMKGKRKEMIREELHEILKNGFGINTIHSEYGMTELLSQAYSKGNGIFEPPPWMKVLIRDTEDPMRYKTSGKTGGVNVIDLANINSCSFIATQDLGKKYDNDSFEILGRFDHSDIRGCNLMII
jgi:phenylacetate-coenzyme A ligase PaaK-like adenylate-forming protein